MKNTHKFGSKLLSSIGGFTLIEVMVAISIIAILSGVVVFSAITTNEQGRDAKRQSDLRALQAAVELYKNRHGRYPEGCRGPNTWSGQQATNYACAGGSNEYIIGLAPEFIKVLPYDKKLNGTNSGYVYRTNTNGTVYKIKAMRTVESEVLTFAHEFRACDVRVASRPDGGLVDASQDREVIGWCGRVYPSNALPTQCSSLSEEWNSSYSVWGGFEQKQNGNRPDNGTNPFYVSNNTNVICQ